MRGGVAVEECAIECAQNGAEHDLQSEDNGQDIVDFMLDLRHLAGLALRVHHDLAVPARVDHQAIDPLRVLEPRLPIQQLLVLSKRHTHASHLQRRVEPMQFFVRKNALKCSPKVAELL